MRGLVCCSPDPTCYDGHATLGLCVPHDITPVPANCHALYYCATILGLHDTQDQALCVSRDLYGWAPAWQNKAQPGHAEDPCLHRAAGGSGACMPSAVLFVG